MRRAWVSAACILIQAWTAAQAQVIPDSSLEPEVEDQIIADLCSDLDPSAVLGLAEASFTTEAGVECAGRVMNALTLDEITGQPEVVASTDALWALTAAALEQEDIAADVRELLNAIRSKTTHPLRSEAWLALVALDVRSGVLPATGPMTPVKLAPPTHYAKLTEGDSVAAVASRWDEMHPLRRRMVAWLIAQHAYADITKTGDDDPPGRTMRLAVLAGWLNNYGAMPEEFLEEFVDATIRAGLWFVSPTPPPVAGTDIVAPPWLVGTASICVVQACNNAPTDDTSVNTQGDKLGRVLYKLINFDAANSWARILISPFVNNTSGLSDGVFWTQAFSVSSTVRGGLEHGDAFNPGENHTSSLAYEFESELTISGCANPLTCATSLTLRSVLTAPTPGLSTEAVIKTATGDINIPIGPQITRIDRTLGDVKLYWKIAGNRSHSGAWEYGGEFAHYIGFALYRPGMLADATAARETRFGLSPDSPRHQQLLQVFLPLKGALLALRGDPENADSIDVAAVLGEFPEGAGHRGAGYWSRLLFLRLAKEWGTQFRPEEQTALAALFDAGSGSARARLTDAIHQELAAWSRVRGALNPAGVNSALAALVAGTGVSQSVDPLIKDLALQLLATEPGELRKRLEAQQAALLKLSDANGILEAMLELYRLRGKIERDAAEAKEHVERLGREAALLVQSE